MRVVRRRQKAAWFVTLGILVAPMVRAQGPEKPPKPAKDRDADYTYVSPGPKKCVEVGNYYLHDGNLYAALSRFQEAVKDNPDYAPAYLGLGKTYEKMKQNQKALEAYQQYLDKLPSAKDAAQANEARRAIARLQKEK